MATRIIFTDPSLWGKDKVGKSVDIESCGQRRAVQIPCSIVWEEGGQGPGLIASTEIDLSSITQGLPSAFMTGIVTAYVAFPFIYNSPEDGTLYTPMFLRFTFNNGFVFVNEYGLYSFIPVVCPNPAKMRVELLATENFTEPDTPSPFTILLLNYEVQPSQTFDALIDPVEP